MTETLSSPAPGIEQHGPPQGFEQQTLAQEAREGVLRDLLPTDFDYAQEAGLIDRFYYDANTGEDGLLHTLAGNLRTAADGSFVAEGFHHEPSAEIVWPSVMAASGESQPVTRVDRKHLEDADSETRREFKEFPLEPYRAQVAIDGLAKYAIHRNKETGEAKLARAKNSMFPKEYDALAVMQAIRIAQDTRDPSQDIPSKNVEGRDVLVADGSAPLMDGTSQMPIRMILDAETGKVMSAIPKTKRKPGIMKLTDKQAEQAIFGSLYKEQ